MLDISIYSKYKIIKNMFYDTQYYNMFDFMKIAAVTNVSAKFASESTYRHDIGRLVTGEIGKQIAYNGLDLDIIDRNNVIKGVVDALISIHFTM